MEQSTKTAAHYIYSLNAATSYCSRHDVEHSQVMLSSVLDVSVLIEQHAQIFYQFTTLEAMAPHMPLALLVAPTKLHHLGLSNKHEHEPEPGLD